MVGLTYLVFWQVVVIRAARAAIYPQSGLDCQDEFPFC
jgi:hypothetical protein